MVEFTVRKRLNSLWEVLKQSNTDGKYIKYFNNITQLGIAKLA